MKQDALFSAFLAGSLRAEYLTEFDLDDEEMAEIRRDFDKWLNDNQQFNPTDAG